MDEGGAGVGVSKQVHTRSVGCARPRVMFGRQIAGFASFMDFSETEKVSSMGLLATLFAIESCNE